MKEQSHKSEMSAALRGDFERLRARGVSAALVPQDEPEPDEQRPVVETASSVEGQAETPVESPAEPGQDEPPARRGWLSRLSGR